MTMRRCHKCGQAYRDPAQPGYNNLCNCGAPLHCCANCLHYVPNGKKLWCLKPDMPVIRDPMAANRCDGFEFMQDGREGGVGPIGPRSEDLRPRDADSARRRWDDLFRT